MRKKIKKFKMQKYGRVRPLFLAVLILLSGLFFEQSWWQIGLIMLVALFIGGYYRYTAPH